MVTIPVAATASGSWPNTSQPSKTAVRSCAYMKGLSIEVEPAPLAVITAILPDGTVQKGRPDHCIGCHAPHFNTWLGICVVGNFDPSNHHHWKPSRPTARQLASLIALCERLMSEYHFGPDHVLRHRDTKQTWCPGRRFPYAAVIARLREYAATHPETRAPHPIAVVRD